jgi:ABC-2 type transport system permease protein
MTSNSLASIEQSQLIAVRTTGWRRGLGNLTRKEIGQWWTTRLWWIQILLWVVMLDGISIVVMSDVAGMGPDQVAQESLQTFMQVAAIAVGIGVVLTIQGSVVGEKEMGTAAWIMSKPASRPSFVLSKIFAHSLGFLVTALLIPSVVFLVAAELMLAVPVEYVAFAAGLGVLALSIVFYVTLTVTLGTLFKGRGPVAGIGIGLILIGQFFKGMLPLPLVQVTPWLLGDTAASFAMQVVPDFNRIIPIVSTAIASLVLVAVAIWRFEREEF